MKKKTKDKAVKVAIGATRVIGLGFGIFGLIVCLIIGLFFIICGIFLCLTIIGAIIGLPLMFVGGLIILGGFGFGFFGAALGVEGSNRKEKRIKTSD